MKILIFIFLFLSWVGTGAQAQPPTIVYLNKCIDESTWTCLNKTQAAKREETREQANKACKRIKCPIIYSVDPIKFRGGFEFGAWKRKGKIYFSAMPKCPNARWILERLLRRK